MKSAKHDMGPQSEVERTKKIKRLSTVIPKENMKKISLKDRRTELKQYTLTFQSRGIIRIRKINYHK